MTSHRSIITLTTDFGVRDPFAGIMKGVIATINREAAVIDITHSVAPGDIREAALILSVSAPYFPSGTVHTVVVDPGVGGSRRAIAVKTADCYLVGPDNGVLSWVLRDIGQATIRQIARPEYTRPTISATFHGRDIFAPAAAHLAAGVPIEALGPAVDDPVLIAYPQAERDAHEIRGEVLYIDGFGNLITNIRPGDAHGFREIAIGGATIDRLSKSYDRAPEGTLIALAGSFGFIEIAVNLGSAMRRLHAQVGDRVRVLL